MDISSDNTPPNSLGRGTLAIVIVVIVAALAFYLGFEHGENQTAVNSSTSTSTPTTVSDYYQTPAEWQTDVDNFAGFSIAYPIDFNVEENNSQAPSTDWRMDSGNTPGNLRLTLTIPSAFEPQTNLVDATLTVGYSGNDAAVASCMTPDQTGGPATATSTMVVNGTTFTVFQSSDAGAGNFYQTWSYRTLHAGNCYAVEYTIHSSQIGNYPPSYNLQPFDQVQLQGVLDRIVGTFSLL